MHQGSGSGERRPRGEAVSGEDEEETDELGDVQNFDVAEASKAAADAGEDRPDGDEPVPGRTVPQLGAPGELQRRLDRPADEEDHRVEVDKRRNGAHPRPRHDAARQAVRLDQRGINR